MMKKYVITRKEVCAGRLIKTNKDVSVNDSLLLRGEILRGMLFSNEIEGVAKDLIYNTPIYYPILGKKTNLNIIDNIFIDHYVELNDLLKYLNYKEDLTQKDLNKIYRMLIAHEYWLLHHKELFGFEKIGNGRCYVKTGDETISADILNNLISISGFNAKPNKKEVGYSMIKKKKIREFLD